MQVPSPILVIISFCLQILVQQTATFRLTNMTAPPLQDPRENMKLHCSFDMGVEDLYAIKWYKDDQEFFRYAPRNGPVEYHVPGVHIQPNQTRCHRTVCDLLLTKLDRIQSSGAYRCEVSTEAPAFRLASQTYNVTVAVIPKNPPKIEGLNHSYLIKDLLVATCTSGPGDPKPRLTWYVNGEQVYGNYVRELPSPSTSYDGHHDAFTSMLHNTKVQLRLPLDKKLIASHNNKFNQTKAATTTMRISCQSSMDGISAIVAPPLIVNKTIIVQDENHQSVSNQKYASIHSAAGAATTSSTTLPPHYYYWLTTRNQQKDWISFYYLLVILIVRWCSC